MVLQLAAVRTVAPGAPVGDHLQPGTLTGPGPVAPAFVPPSEKAAAGPMQQRKGSTNGMDGVTPKATMSVAAPAFEPSRASAPDAAADLGDCARLDIQLGDFAARTEPVSTAASAVGPAKAFAASTSQPPRNVCVTTAASAVSQAVAASDRPPLRSASTISDASSEPAAKVTASEPHLTIRSQTSADSKPPVPAMATSVDGPVSPVPSQSSKALLRVFSELSSVAECGADGVGDGTAAPVAAESPKLATAGDDAPLPSAVPDSASGTTDSPAESIASTGKAEQSTCGDVPAEIEAQNSQAAAPASGTVSDSHLRMLSFGDFSPRAISMVTTVGFVTDPLVAFLGPSAVQLPGSLSFASSTTTSGSC